MLDSRLPPGRPASPRTDVPLFAALERASGAIARLDQALDNHPLLPAFLYRARLEAVRRQAAVDGQGIDPWHLAAVLEGLRLRMDHALRIIDRGEVFEAVRTALMLHQWITEPDFDQEGEVQAAERHLAGASGPADAGDAVWTWLDGSGSRPPIRAALIRFWTKRRLLRAPIPLTGPRALSPEAPAGRAEWVIAFLEALAIEAADDLELLRRLEHGWLAARGKVTGRRSTSRATTAVDVLAASPLLSATTLARDRHIGEVRDRVARSVRRGRHCHRGHTPCRPAAVRPRGTRAAPRRRAAAVSTGSKSRSRPAAP